MKREYLIAVLVAVLPAFGCGDGDTDAPETIKIGVIIPSSLPNAAAFVQGAEFAVQQANASGGVLGRNVELVVADEGDDAEAARSAMTELLDERGVHVLLGPMFPATAIPNMDLVTSRRVSMVSVLGGLDHAWLDAVAEVAETYAFTFAKPAIQLVGPTVDAALHEDVGACQHIAMAVQTHTRPNLAEAYVAAAEAKLEAAGLTLAGSRLLPQAPGDYAAEVAALQELGPDCVILDVPLAELGPFLNAWHASATKGAAVKFLRWDQTGTDVISTATTGASSPDYLVDLLVVTVARNAVASSFYNDWAKAFAADIGTEPVQPNTPFFMDGAAALMLSMEAAQTPTGTAVRDAMLQVTQRNEGAASNEQRYGPLQLDDALQYVNDQLEIDYVGASGTVDFHEDTGVVREKFRILRVVDGTTGETRQVRLINTVL